MTAELKAAGTSARDGVMPAVVAYGDARAAEARKAALEEMARFMLDGVKSFEKKPRSVEAWRSLFTLHLDFLNQKLADSPAPEVKG